MEDALTEEIIIKLAEVLSDIVEDYFRDPQHQKSFEEWQKTQMK